MSETTGQRKKYELVASQLEASLQQAPSGQKLPSIRALMQSYDASQATIDRSLSLLIDRGLLKRVPDKGVFVADDPAAASRPANVELCFFLEEDALSQNILYSQMMSRMLTVAREHAMHLQVSAYDELGGLDEFRRRAERNRPDAMVLMCVSRVNFELVLRSMNIPTLLLFPTAMQRCSNCVLIDDNSGINQAVDHLRELGHRKIGYLHGQGFHGVYHRAQVVRLDAFYTAMRRHRVAIPSSYVEYGGFTPGEGYSAAKNLLRLTDRPTAIICNDYNFMGVYQAAGELGLRIPEDLSVVGHDNVTPSEASAPPLTTVDIMWPDIVARVVQAVDDLMNDPAQDGRVIKTPVELMVRESTGPCG